MSLAPAERLPCTPPAVARDHYASSRRNKANGHGLSFSERLDGRPHIERDEGLLRWESKRHGCFNDSARTIAHAGAVKGPKGRPRRPTKDRLEPRSILIHGMEGSSVNGPPHGAREASDRKVRPSEGCSAMVARKILGPFPAPTFTGGPTTAAPALIREAVIRALLRGLACSGPRQLRHSSAKRSRRGGAPVFDQASWRGPPTARRKLATSCLIVITS